jgi:hypothetical protein
METTEMKAYTLIGLVNNETKLNPKEPVSSPKPIVKHTYTPSKGNPSHDKHILAVNRKETRQRKYPSSPQESKFKDLQHNPRPNMWLRDDDCLNQMHNQNNT